MQVLIVDACWACQAGWRSLVESLGVRYSVIEASEFSEAIDVGRKSKDVGLVLLGAPVPGFSLSGALTKLRGQLPDLSVVVLGMTGERAEALQALEFGAIGYIPKTDSREDMLHGLRRVLAGEVWVPKSAVASVGREASETSGQSARPSLSRRRGLDVLTDRQRDVLAGLAAGKTNAAIATQLGLSTNTVRLHVSAVLKALGVANRTQAARVAADQRLGP